MDFFAGNPVDVIKLPLETFRKEPFVFLEIVCNISGVDFVFIVNLESNPSGNDTMLFDQADFVFLRQFLGDTFVLKERTIMKL